MKLKMLSRSQLNALVLLGIGMFAVLAQCKKDELQVTQPTPPTPPIVNDTCFNVIMAVTITNFIDSTGAYTYVTLPPDTTRCACDTLTLDGSTDTAYNFLWSTGSMSRVLQIIQDSSYSLQVTPIDSSTAPAADTINVSPGGC
jgi:hypothetical protein